MPAKILITDDAAYMRMVIKDILLKDGYEIVGECESGEDAVNKYGELKPDLVTMDIVMLGMSGIDSVKKLIEIDPQVKILMISALGQQALVVEAIQAGAKGFVIKPFTPNAILEETKRILNE